jgi:hypothetical protein
MFSLGNNRGMMTRSQIGFRMDRFCPFRIREPKIQIQNPKNPLLGIHIQFESVDWIIDSEAHMGRGRCGLKKPHNTSFDTQATNLRMEASHFSHSRAQ